MKYINTNNNLSLTLIKLNIKSTIMDYTGRKTLCALNRVEIWGQLPVTTMPYVISEVNLQFRRKDMLEQLRRTSNQLRNPMFPIGDATLRSLLAAELTGEEEEEELCKKIGEESDEVDLNMHSIITQLYTQVRKGDSLWPNIPEYTRLARFLFTRSCHRLLKGKSFYNGIDQNELHAIIIVVFYIQITLRRVNMLNTYSMHFVFPEYIVIDNNLKFEKKMCYYIFIFICC